MWIGRVRTVGGDGSLMDVTRCSRDPGRRQRGMKTLKQLAMRFAVPVGSLVAVLAVLGAGRKW
jgi:hypothetical protein